MIDTIKEIIDVFQNHSLVLIFLPSFDIFYLIYVGFNRYVLGISQPTVVAFSTISLISSAYIYTYISGSLERAEWFVDILFLLSVIIIFISLLFSITHLYILPWTTTRYSVVLFLLTILSTMLIFSHELIKEYSTGYNREF